jgi:hypothetical protein
MRDKPLRVTLAQYASEEFLQKIRDLACERCVIRLACMSEVMPNEYYWCKKCQGWWLVEEELLIQCNGHFLNEQMPAARASTWRPQEEHGIEDCPNCTPSARCVWGRKDGSRVEGEPQSVRVIVGFSITEDA